MTSFQHCKALSTKKIKAYNWLSNWGFGSGIYESFKSKDFLRVFVG
jgi:hypothetical protein